MAGNVDGLPAGGAGRGGNGLGVGADVGGGPVGAGLDVQGGALGLNWGGRGELEVEEDVRGRGHGGAAGDGDASGRIRFGKESSIDLGSLAVGYIVRWGDVPC